MPETSLRRHVPYKPQDLLEFVANVEDYPTFINLLSAVRKSDETVVGDNQTEFEASATVAYKFFRENFHSLVRVDKATNRIDVSKASKGGAVKTLQNRWIFHELSDGSTLVDFYVSVSLKAFPLEMLVKDKFGRASEYIMNLFMARAAQVCTKVEGGQIDLAAETKTLGLA